MNDKKKGKSFSKNQKNRKRLILPLYSAGLLAMIFLGAFLALGSGNLPDTSTSTPATAEVTKTDQPGANSRSLELTNTLFSQARNTRGDPAAPVTIIEFSDFQ
jgi:hypothetical protein